MATTPTQIGLGSSGVRTAYSVQKVIVDVTGITGLSSAATYIMGVDFNRSIREAMPDLLSRVGIYPPFVLSTTNKPKYKLTINDTRNGSTYNDVADLGKTWAESGVHAGDTIKIKDA